MELENQGLVKKIQKTGTVVQKLSSIYNLKFIIDTRRDISQTSVNQIFIKLNNALMDRAAQRSLNLEIMSEQQFLMTIKENPNHGIDGIIVFQNIMPQTFELIKKRNIPCVLTLPPESDPEMPSVVSDMFTGGYLATRHLLKNGHKRIALLSGIITNPWFLPRFEGYQKALSEAKVPFDWKLVRESNGFSHDEIFPLVKELLNLPEPPTAFFAMNDFRAIACLRYCERQGLKIPEDISIIGFDNILESSFSVPPLSTIDALQDEAAEISLDIILNLIENKETKKQNDIFIKPVVKSRMSVKSLNNE
jgi:DNA-binding LacI/PurR family transcriptional regulator